MADEPQGQLNTKTTGRVSSEPTPEARDMTRAIYYGLEDETRKFMNAIDESRLSARQKQKLAAEVITSLFTQLPYADRFCQWALDNPGDAAHLAAKVIPKEIHQTVEKINYVAQMPSSKSEDEWESQAVDADVVSNDHGWEDE